MEAKTNGRDSQPPECRHRLMSKEKEKTTMETAYDTTVACGTSTRDELKAYRDDQGLKNYDRALSQLLQEVDR